MAVTQAQAEAALADPSLQEELLLDELDDFDEPEHIREARMQALKREMDAIQTAKSQGTGELKEITEEREFLQITTSCEKVVCHFYHEDFRRCSIMDEHLKKLAKKHFTTKFIKADVEKCKFFVAKLKIQVLPAVFSFVGGIVRNRIVGFDALGNTDTFPTERLEKLLAAAGVVAGPGLVGEVGSKGVFGKKYRERDDSDSDDDED